jgi:hypothetical protein
MLVLPAAPGATLPPELGQDVLVLDEPLPSTSHPEQIVRETFNAAELREPERSVIAGWRGAQFCGQKIRLK